MKKNANSNRKLTLVPSKIANHVHVVAFEAGPVPTRDGIVRKYPRDIKANGLQLLEGKDADLPIFLKWARPSARLPEGKTMFVRKGKGIHSER
jgi:hypothetical protein